LPVLATDGPACAERAIDCSATIALRCISSVWIVECQQRAVHVEPVLTVRRSVIRFSSSFG